MSHKIFEIFVSVSNLEGDLQTFGIGKIYELVNQLHSHLSHIEIARNKFYTAVNI